MLASATYCDIFARDRGYQKLTYPNLNSVNGEKVKDYSILHVQLFNI